MHSTSLFRKTICPSLLAIAAALPAQSGTGPRDRDQITTVNVNRAKLLKPASSLYDVALKECGVGDEEVRICREAGHLAGCCYTFGLVVVDPNRYLANQNYKRHIDHAFDEVRRSTEAIEALSRQVPEPTWEKLLPTWNHFKEAYAVVARFWDEKNESARRVQEIELRTATTATKVGDPVVLDVFVRYTDGSREQVESPRVSWLLRPDHGVTVNTARQFLASEAGVYQVTAVYDELISPSVVIRVAKQPRALLERDLTGTFLGHKTNFALVKSIPCRAQDEPFDALKIRVLDRPARIGDVTVYFTDGTSETLWRGRYEVRAPGEYLIGSFVGPQRILRFDVRTQGQDGNYSRQLILGVRRP